MDETTWNTCTDPQAMLDFLRDNGTISDRKLRLFAVACCRLFWDCLNIDATRAAVETSERYADNRATDKELSRARNAAHNAGWYARSYRERAPYCSEDALRWLHYTERLGHLTEEIVRRLYFVAFMTNTTQRLRKDDMPMLRTDPVLALVSPSLFRDIFTPFHPAGISTTWLAWSDGTIPKLAEAIYEERSFEHLPILADALEEAGCDSAELLAHLRSPGPHARGCWVIDAVLGRS